MKKICLLFLVLFASCFCYAQDTITRSIGSYTYGFETNLDGWTLIDNDGDGHCWYHTSEASNHNATAIPSHNGVGHVRGESYCNSFGALTPDDYLVSPQRYGIVNGSTISFWACAQDINYPAEHFGVAVSTSASGNTNASSFTTIQEWTLTAKSVSGPSIGRNRNQTDHGTWHQYTCNLSSYAGQKVWIAIRHFNCTDQFIICLDDLQINNVDTWTFENVFVTDPGAMADGSDASWTKGSQTTWGVNANHNGSYRLADEFTVNAQTNINEITVYGYQTGSSTTSTFTGLYAQIFNGNPMNGGSSVWGNNTTNIMTVTSFTNCYRGSNGYVADTTKPIMSITASGLNIQLAAGTYYLVYNLTGSESSGPWGVPQCEPNIGNTGNGLQYTSNGWITLLDSGSNTPYGCSMTLRGTQQGGTTYYTITTSASPTNGGTTTGGGSYASGSTCTVHANAATGYNFLRWTENGNQVSTNANYTFTVNSNRNLVAHFQAQSYTISVSANPSNGGTVTGSGQYQQGQSCTVTATAATGYTFSRWTENGQQVSTQASYTFTVNGNRNLVAQFQAQSYTISVSASPTNGGTVSGGGTYNYGQSCTVHANANSGYTFSNWTESGNVVSTNANYTFTVTGNRTLVANFTALPPNTYNINVSANPSAGGTVTGGGSYQQGQSCTVTATANPGYTFLRWTENGSQVNTNASYTFTVNSNRTLVAQFSQQDYTISVSANPNNGGSVTGGGAFHYGEICTVTAIANDGYSFTNWTENGVAVAIQADYQFIVTGSRTLVANFQAEANNYTIGVSANPSDGGTVTGGGTYTEGSTCILTASPSSGYIFEKWTKNGTVVSTSPVYSFIVTENADYIAHFSESANQYTVTAIAIPAAGGTITGGGTYEQGAICNLSASANNGYSFVNWTDSNGTLLTTSAEFSFTVTGNVIYLANFTQSVNTYNITASTFPDNGGTVSGEGAYEAGATCTLIATPNPTYTFMNWTENGIVVSTEDHYSFTVDRERNLVAVFSQGLFYTISAIAGVNGSISPEGDVMVQPGEDKTFTMIPNTGCRVSKVLVDGIDVGPIESYTFRSVNGNHSIRVQFSGLGVDDNCLPELKIYPNPANDKINIECPNMKRFSIFNVLGIPIISKDVNNDYAVVSTDEFPQGTYILKVENNERRIGYSRFVVVK